MSNIDDAIIPPGNRPPPGGAPPLEDPSPDGTGSDDIREPGADVPPVTPDPEEGRNNLPNIEHV
ncbi:hypothetical protein [Mangrovibrevibacter kandeliae]|uniref:hypothetical protein n=1 Tax=Mangrovibrevibacter kandeliae TaxID=2968473 RepID=UPI0021191CEC|nr:hypothetical protein [Aurantimonas sp. CSK15Z-1]MCQ8784155.1 hypothetical protein [Aurantimonas sp. CSK15Z-1]